MTLFGGIAKENTYYKHKATTHFECFVEAYYHFNKAGKTKEQLYKKAVEAWRNDKEEVERLLKRHREENNKKKSSDKPRENYFLKQSSTITKKSLSATTSTTNASIAIEQTPVEQGVELIKGNGDLSSIENFLEKLRVGLSCFVKSISQEKLVLASLDSLAKCYASISTQIDFLKENTIRTTKESSLQKDIAELLAKLTSLTLLIVECDNIIIKPSLGLMALQEQVIKKSKLCNEIAVIAMGIKCFVDNTKLKNNLNRRVAQIKQRKDISCDSDKISQIQFFCCNGFDLTWENGINNLVARLDYCTNLPMPANEIIHIASLLQSSSLVPVEELLIINTNINDSVINLLIKHLPIYSIVFGKDELRKCILVNFLQTSTSCDIIDLVVGLNKEISTESKNGKKF